jgi:hypothetical protein
MQPTNVGRASLPLLWLAFLTTSTAAQAPGRVTAADLVWRLSPLEADSAAVRSVWGPPRTRDVWFVAPTGESAPRWSYGRHGIYYDISAAAVIAIEFTAPGPRTRRGLQVGDRGNRVRALYGTPLLVTEEVSHAEGTEVWRYEGHTGAVTVTLRQGRVERILLGSDLTGE